MKKVILLPSNIHESGKNILMRHGYEVKLGRGNSEQEICEDVIGCVGIIARTGKFSNKVINAEKGLKVIARHGTGVDNVDLQAAKDAGVIVTNDPTSNINAVAEHVIALLISCSKRIVFQDTKVRNDEFDIRNKIDLYELHGKTLGIVGFGKIGRLVAKKAALGFDMNVIVYDPFFDKSSAPEYIQVSEAWNDIYKNSDFISVNVPLTPETQKSIGAKEFSMMKPTACFINCARGEILDENALIEALKNKKILMAGLDVFEKEPPLKDNMLYAMNNVILTPHSAALTVEAMEKMSVVAAQSIIEVLEGKEISHRVI